MPLFGVRDVATLLEHAPAMEGLGTEPVTLPRVEVLHAMFEIDERVMQALLPRALHPTIPPTATFVFWRCADGPLGPFTLAQVRVGCRAGVRPRGFLAASYCDAGNAAHELRTRWGFDCRPGVVELRRYYDRIIGSVTAMRRTILQVSLIDPQAISGADVQYIANMNLARVPGSRSDDGSREPGTGNQEPGTRLVQVDPEYTFHRAERGRPVVDQLVAEAWSAEGLVPVYPVSATYCTCDITLPRIRYIVDPDRPAMQATERVQG